MKRLLILTLPLIIALFIGWGDWGGGGGSGDMTKAVYDKNDDGFVDSAAAPAPASMLWNRESTDVYWSESIPEMRSDAAESAAAAITVMKASPQTISAEWNFDEKMGVIDGHKFFITDGDDTLFWQIVNDTVFVWTNSGIPIVFGDEGKALFDSIEIGGGETIIKWDQVGGQLAMIANDLDTFYAPLDSVDDEGAGAAADDWVWLTGLRWIGGNESNNKNVSYYSTGANVDTLWSFPFTIPIEFDGNDIILDSLIYNYRNEGTEDSSKAYLEKITAMTTLALVDSTDWLTGTSSYLNANIINNGDYTLLDGVSYRIYIITRNDGADDLRVGFHIRGVGHVEP